MLLTWDQVLQRKDLIGGNARIIEGGETFQGSIININDHNGRISFIQEWMAVRRGTEWARFNDGGFIQIKKELSLPKSVSPNRIQFTILGRGTVTIYPVGDPEIIDVARLLG